MFLNLSNRNVFSISIIGWQLNNERILSNNYENSGEINCNMLCKINIELLK